MVKLVQSSQVTGRRRLGLLPAEATSFVGREAELSAITDLLTSARLVTVTGPAGVGKTRTCLRAAGSAAERFPDGTWLVELYELLDAALIADSAILASAPLVRDLPLLHDTTLLRHTELIFDAVAAAIGLPDAGEDSQRAAVLDHLRDRRPLLILDTCDHLLDACAAFVESVLAEAPGVTLLTTSRQPLDAPGEYVFRMPPLRMADEAIELFAQRAAAVMPGFEVTPENRADAVRLCQRLDGIPLAIELAAVPLRALPLRDLANRLADGFGVLAASRRGTTGRHQSLRTAVEWSYKLCTPAEQLLWARLAVFGGPFDVAAAEDVCADAALPRDQVIGSLIGLVDKSVVLCAVPDSGESGYRLTGAARALGAEKLATEPGFGDDDRDDVQARVADRLTARCLSLATHFDQNFLDDDQVDRYRELRREHGNLTAALEHTLGDASPPASTGDVLVRARAGATLAIRLQGYWQMSGLLSEGRFWLGKVLRQFGAGSSEHAWALGIDGRLATFAGDLAGARTTIKASITMAADLGEPLAESLGYLYLNLALAHAGEPALALAAGETARVKMTACEHRLGLIALEAQMGQLHQLSGDAEEAVACCERGLAMLGPASGERWITSYLYLVYGFALFQRPDRTAECTLAVRRALAATHEIGDAAGIAYALEILGWLAAEGARFDEAALLLGAADPMWRATSLRLSSTARLEETHQRMAQRAREALGDRRYAAAYAKGAGMPLRDVVRRAAETAEPTAPTPSAIAIAGGDGADGPGRGRLSAALTAVPLTAAPPSGRLTKREREISGLVASGLSNRQIATQLFISKRTVDAHVEHIFAKLEISSRVQLTVWLASAAPAVGS